MRHRVRKGVGALRAGIVVAEERADSDAAKIVRVPEAVGADRRADPVFSLDSEAPLAQLTVLPAGSGCRYRLALCVSVSLTLDSATVSAKATATATSAATRHLLG